jgi:hypothetical protein
MRARSGAERRVSYGARSLRARSRAVRNPLLPDENPRPEKQAAEVGSRPTRSRQWPNFEAQLQAQERSLAAQ